MQQDPSAAPRSVSKRLLLLSACLILFALIVWQIVSGGPLVRFDMWVQQALAPMRGPLLITIATVVTLLGNYYVVAALTFLGALFLAICGAWRNVSCLLISMIGAGLSVIAIKALVERPRPVPVDGVVVTSSSFPSGNSTLSAALFAAAILVVIPVVMRDRSASLFTLLAIAAPVLVAASRVMLSVHYVSDTLAGLAIGSAWALAGSLLIMKRN